MLDFSKITFPRVPSIVYQVIFVLLCIFTITVFLVKKEYQSRKKWLLVGLLVVFVFLMLCSTVLYRRTGTHYQLLLTPFACYKKIFEGNVYVLTEKLLNFLLFIPLGILLGGIFGKGKFWQVVLIGCLFSVSIELLQLVLKRGYSEVDDVIHNTLGCMMGYGVWRGINDLVKKRG